MIAISSSEMLPMIETDLDLAAEPLLCVVDSANARAQERERNFFRR
jgi:hypothetical protein